jgi:predicted dehydrogenase
MIRIGIIGCGKIAQTRHIPEYLANHDAQMVAFYDLNYARAQELAKQYQARAYQSYEELLADTQIDAVSICVANVAHAAISIAALRAGKAVLCEKPMAMTIEDCEEMVRVAKEENQILMIDQNQRLTKAHQLAKELIERGELGKVLTFRTTFGHGGPETWSIDPGKDTWFFRANEAKLGVMADLGVHKTDLIQYLLSQTVVQTTAKVMTLEKKDNSGNLIQVEDNAICIYQMSGGTVGTMTASWTYCAAEDNTTVLYGTEGELRIYEDPKYAVILRKKDGTQQKYEVEQIQTNDNQTTSGVIDVFLQCIKAGEATILSGESVLSAMRAVFASVESSKEGRSIAVEES